MKVPPGKYEVVLSPLAVSSLLFWMTFTSFSATPYQNGQSFVKHHLNERIFDEKLSVKDDARDPQALYAVPIDGEGVPKKALQLINKGAVSEQSICYDSFTAGKEGKQSTGHSIPPVVLLSHSMPPIALLDQPINIVVSPGDASI